MSDDETDGMGGRAKVPAHRRRRDEERRTHPVQILMITGLVPVPLPHQFPLNTGNLRDPELATALPSVTVLNNAKRATTAFEVSGNPAPLTK